MFMSDLNMKLHLVLLVSNSVVGNEKYKIILLYFWIMNYDTSTTRITCWPQKKQIEVNELCN